MNPRATIALLLVTLLVVGSLYYLRMMAPATREAEELRRYAAVFEPDDIAEIDIIRGTETVSLRRETTGWSVVAPVQDRAAPGEVDRLLATLRFLMVRDRLASPEPAAVAEAGLAAPRLRFDLRGEREPLRIEFGANTALPEEIFARVSGQSDLLRVADTIVELATAPVGKFRDARLTPFVPDDIEKFTVRRADGEMTVRRERGRWLIEKPVTAPADPQAVRSFLDALLGLPVVKFEAPAPEAAPLPGQTAAISLTPMGGGEALSLEVTRGAGTEAETLTARFAPRGGLLEVGGAANLLFEVSPEALRDRSLGYVEPDAIDRIAMESDGQVFELQRQGEAWTDPKHGMTVTNEEIDALIELFNNTRAVSFQPGLTAKDAGLEPPAQRLLFSAWLSENSAEEAAGRHPMAGVELGAAGGETCPARVTGTEEILMLPPDLAQAIRQIAQPPAAPAAAP
jgi:hypothetical protein